MTEHTYVLQVSDDARIQIWGFRKSIIKMLLALIAYVLSIGFVRLIFYWQPKWHIRLTMDKCTLQEATVVLICDDHFIWTWRKIRLLKTAPDGKRILLPTTHGDMLEVDELRYFTFRKLKFLWHTKLCQFQQISSLDQQVYLSRYHQMSNNNNGLDDAEVCRRVFIFGHNMIDVILKPLILVLLKEVVGPFYIFQLFSVCVWFNDEYYYYAGVIIIMSTLSISANVYQIRTEEIKLRKMVHSTGMVEVVRNNGLIQVVGSDQLVPGDLLNLSTKAGGTMLHCDAVLLGGTAIVNESMLTGESVPVTKVSLPQTDVDDTCIYNNKEHAKHTLYCGTVVLQTRSVPGRRVQALVIRTGYATFKGQLVRSIMYPKPIDFRFTKDFFKFVGVLSIIAAIGFVYAIIIMHSQDAPLKKVIIRALDLITIVIPPALPAAMTIGIVAAQVRLKKSQIFCISPSTINTCGVINTVCFDKTGTLTEDGLDFNCILPVRDTGNTTTESVTFGESSLDFDLYRRPDLAEMLNVVASCHGLSKIDGKLCGDPLDVILFEKTGWELDDDVPTTNDDDVDDIGDGRKMPLFAANLDNSSNPTVTVRMPQVIIGNADDDDDDRNEKETQFDASTQKQLEIVIIRQFTFSSNLQRMSVIVRTNADTNSSSSSNGPIKSENDHRFQLYCKGAPEKIASLCMKETIPKNYNQILDNFTHSGYRLIAIAKRSLDISPNAAMKINRDLATGSMNDGITGNRSTIGSQKSITDIENSRDGFANANYQIAIDGETFGFIVQQHPQLLDRLVCVCNVYARMSPEQKQLLVHRMQAVEYTVAMCGDGANDCGALKAAHAGISLSDAEASIAAPFTSRVADIRCVPTVIREGRAALVTSFGIFKYMAGYSLTQFSSILLLYMIASSLTNFQFLYIDLFLITVYAIVFGYTGAADQLHERPPPARLMSLASVVSILGNIAIIGIIQGFIYVFTIAQDWFQPYKNAVNEEISASMQGTAIFCVSTFQYVSLAIIYSKGAPHRQSIITNRPLCISILVTSICNILVVLWMPPFIVDFLQFIYLPELSYRLLLLTISVHSGLLCYLFETYLVDYVILLKYDNWQRRKRLAANREDKNVPKYERLLKEIGADSQWIRTFIDDAESRQCDPLIISSSAVDRVDK